MWQSILELLRNLPLILQLIAEIKKLVNEQELRDLATKLGATIEYVKEADDDEKRKQLAARLSDLVVRVRKSKSN